MRARIQRAPRTLPSLCSRSFVARCDTRQHTVVSPFRAVEAPVGCTVGARRFGRLRVCAKCGFLWTPHAACVCVRFHAACLCLEHTTQRRRRQRQPHISCVSVCVPFRNYEAERMQRMVLETPLCCCLAASREDVRGRPVDAVYRARWFRTLSRCCTQSV